MALTRPEIARRISKKLPRSNPATAQESLSNTDTTTAAATAVYDRLVASKAILNADIEAAAPGIYNATQKAIIFSEVARLFAEKEGA